ncbi:DUF3560 domain-containing protein [Streptomyces canus]|uniref:DUF3560 domain-containing protein n=1 Tax=Streptomyces canus TaxID=58343 RepID=UPI003415A5A4
MTYRERRLAKAERLQDWAAGRERKAAASHDAARRYIEAVPFGQPILVGHHSERRARRDQARFNADMQRGFDHTTKAEEMRSKAANIEAAAARSIYSDDPDAVEQLEARPAELESKRDRIKTYNKSVKGEGKDLTVLTAEEV